MPVQISPLRLIERVVPGMVRGELNSESVAVFEAFGVTTDSTGKATVTLSRVPDTTKPIVAVSLNPTLHAGIVSVSVSVVTVALYTHLHRHKWLSSGSIAGATATSTYYWELWDGRGWAIQDTAGNPIYFISENYNGDYIAAAYTDAEGTPELSPNTTASVGIFYVPEV